MIFEAKQLSHSFGQQLVLDQVSMVLHPKKLHVLVGESGVGKSTLLKIFACLSLPDEGQILLNGSSLDSFARHLVRGHPKIKFVPQDFQLLPNHTIRENIQFTLKDYTTDYQEYRLNFLLNRLGLETIQKRFPREISGGEKQRTAIARAIADEPAVLLLDEPFSNLDLPNRQKLKSDLASLINEFSTACLLVTHDIFDALTCADTLSVMASGKVFEVGTPKDFFSIDHPELTNLRIATSEMLQKIVPLIP